MTPTTKIRTLVLKPGERVLIPSGATIKSITTDGDIDVTSECPLPEAAVFGCFEVRWGLAKHGTASSNPWEYAGSGSPDDTNYVGVGYGENFFAADINGNLELSILNHIKTSLGSILLTGNVGTGSTGEIDTRKILMKLPEDIGNELYLKFNVQHYGPIRIYAQASEDCGETDGTGGSLEDVLGISTTTTTTLP